MKEDLSKLPASPRPEPPREHDCYWEGLKEHKLRAQKCSNCGSLRLYPRPMCGECYSMEFEWKDLKGTVKIHSWATSHHPFHAGFKNITPYLTVTVDLNEGLRLQAPMYNHSSDESFIGMDVSVAFENVDEELTLPHFKPTKT